MGRLFVRSFDLPSRVGCGVCLNALVGRGLPILPRDCQGRLPVAWVKYDI